MHYIVYKITNKTNGKIYVGKHQTKNLNDGYMGSGKNIVKAIEKYGIDNFTKEILFEFDNEIDMNYEEKNIVSEYFCKRNDTYNICPGGDGGFGYINSKGLNLRNGMIHSKETRQKLSDNRKGKLHSKETREKLSKNNWSKTNPNEHKKHISNIHKGKSKTKEHKEKISTSLKGKCKEKIICPYCNLEGALPIMKRWHFDNCKKYK